MNDIESIRSVLPLLTEYTAKLRNLDVNEPEDQMYFQNLQPSARKLAQFVSQRLSREEEGTLRLELELRLAEFEAALRQAAFPRKRKAV